MLFNYKILTFIIWTYSYFGYLNALDLSSATSLLSSKKLNCYQCSTLESDDCKNTTLIKQNPSFVKECGAEATGCLKQFVKRANGRNATFYECYYDDISRVLTDFSCETIPRTRQYVETLCYKCRGDLCNNSNHLTQSTSGVFLKTFFVLLIVRFLSRV